MRFSRIFMSPAAGSLAGFPHGELIPFNRMLVAFRNDGVVCYIGIPSREGEDPELLRVRLTAASHRLAKINNQDEWSRIYIPEDLPNVISDLHGSFPPYVSRNHFDWTDVTGYKEFTWIVSRTLNSEVSE